MEAVALATVAVAIMAHQIRVVVAVVLANKHLMAAAQAEAAL